MVTSHLMLYSKSAEYAIQAMIYLTEKKSDKPTMISKIAESYGIPYQFLAKIVQTLVKHRLVKATRGRNGGVNLGRPANEIYLSEIVQAIDGLPPEKEQCVIGLNLCSDETPCPLHDQWKPIRGKIRHMLASEPLDDLANRVIEKRKLMEK
ncbi:MAG: Rrf2 family transcriptional regulator [Candidatus Marinimicrobia bacterium]|nr:Rrf2 family transcriptional regulator [Candidatus Neomarinimicrobiota bacterium]MBT3675036.1 Rrf2 family transcriptional regulator [Candidatus Neomarinimicrobiota bacterium]MBT3762727.1 Rrf2 family transcriptional regulator [Candidatus Neomarinimicrobiota bacterium]MBT4068740.1 Rrf2 family transcriptional regulator [Candidatus Neomarinimicrobiota bacterium]MBT4271307.1 Rrf2 family transcriptional regulator [Candidatus Neomarinimicrobiota bacterium]